MIIPDNYAETKTEATSSVPVSLNDQVNNLQKERDVNFKITKDNCDFTSTDSSFGYRILPKSAKEVSISYLLNTFSRFTVLK